MSYPEKTRFEFETYFWSLVRMTKKCWYWTGGHDGKGYGRIYRRQKYHAVHRLSWEFCHGRKIPKGLFICHHCDNKLCVNPMHLFVGTQVDNMQDWTRKGKNKLINNPRLWKRGDKHWTRKKSTRTKKLLKEISERRKREFRTGRRVMVRDKKGHLLGTRMVS